MEKYVLVVDDNAVNRRILNKILSTEYAVLEAGDGSEALRVFLENRGRIIAIMLDLIMPGMDGYEFLRVFARDEDIEHIPVIVSTGQTDKDNEIEALRLGAWDFIIKPYVPEIIRFRLKNAIVRSQLSAFQELKYKAEFDVLTGIYNKDKFFEITAEMLRSSPNLPFTMIRFDIDRFHLINSYFGTGYGDRLLQYIGKAIHEKMQEESPLGTFGRISADVFAVCIPTDDKAIIEATVCGFNEIVKAFDKSFDIVSCFGIHIIRDRHLPVTEIYDRATLAAKSNKGNYLRNYAYFADSMEKNVQMEQEIINDMNSAIKEEQFVVWYQPKYDIRINAPAGAEALVRWNHPEKGMISPGRFLPVFEHNGFITTLDYYVWEHVCCDMRRWLDEGRAVLPISVNVSRVHLANPQLVSSIVALVDRYGIPHEMFNLELTESAYTDNPEKAIIVMSELQEQGFIILMDDFGSGYSSLSVLKDIDVDVLKIDMQFFSQTAVEGRSKSIIASVIRMAKWLRIPVVAEGVETREQADFLRELDCEYVQGYFIAKPMPADAYRNYIDAFHAADAELYTAAKHAGSWENDLPISDIKQAAAMFEYQSGQLRIIHVNNHFYDLFGYRNKEERFSDPLSCVEAEYRSSFLKTFADAMETKETTDFEYRRSIRGGSRMWIHMMLRYIGPVGNRGVYYGIFADMTALRQAEEEIPAGAAGHES